MDLYNYLKALHLIFVITWFAGLFYIVRLFVYHAEAVDKPEPEQGILINQYKLMSRRLWNIITWPSAILASVFAFWMLFFTPMGKAWLAMPWMHIKLGFVFLLYVYHLKCHQLFKHLQRDQIKYSASFFRLWTEGATLLLFAIVFIVILKSTLSWIFGVLGLFGLAILLMIGIKAYKRYREKHPNA